MKLQKNVIWKLIIAVIILSISLKDKYNDYNTIKQMYEKGDLL